MPTPKPLALVATAATQATFAADVGLIVVAVPRGALADILKQPQLAPYAASLAAAADDEGFEGKASQTLSYRVQDDHPAPRTTKGRGSSRQKPCHLLLLGLGKADRITPEGWVRLGGRASRAGVDKGCGHVAVLPGAVAAVGDLAALAQGLGLGVYSYRVYKTEADTQRAPLTRVSVVTAHPPAQAKEALAVGAAIARGVSLARDWVNCPPNAMYPEAFVAAAKKQLRGTKITLQVLGPKQMAKANMGMLLGVGQASVRPPQLLCLSYRGRGGKNAATTALVGKGITFDSGGLCIKTCDGMGTMKMDMGGAAAVFAAVWVAATLKLPNPVQGYMALAENMVAGNALRPGDVLKSAAGLTVEVNNTDAEGRLVLGDALHYATLAKPHRIVDVATLTGACMVALGPKTIGLFSNDDALATGLLAAARAGGEDMWRMPLTPSLADQLRSDVADMRNTGDRYGGAITAALFLQKFVGKTPWAHLDIAGPAWSAEDSGHARRGGTGAAVATLVRLLMAPSDAEGRPRGRR